MESKNIPIISNTSPTSNNRVSDGYPIGKRWYNNVKKIYYEHRSDGVWKVLDDADPDNNLPRIFYQYYSPLNPRLYDIWISTKSFINYIYVDGFWVSFDHSISYNESEVPEENGALSSLLNLIASGENQGIYKTGSNSFENRTFGDMLKSVYDPIGGYRQVAFLDQIPNLSSYTTQGFAIAMSIAL